MSSWQNFKLAPADSAAITRGITAVSRIPNSMEVWWIGQDGSIQDANWYEGGQWNRFTLAPAGSASNPADPIAVSITAVSRIPNSMEIWWIGENGSVQGAFWYEGGQWGRYELAPAGSASLTGGIKAVSRIPNSMEVWWIGQDGSIQDANWYEGGQWNRFTLAPAGSASLTGSITAVSRIPNSMEVWWIGQDGSIQDAYWYEGSQWNRFTLAPAGSASSRSSITAVSRIPTSMEVWWIGQDGSIQDAYWYEGSQWNRFTLAPAHSANDLGSITAVSRIPNSMEVWWIGQDNSIQDANWYEGDQWNRFTLAPTGNVSFVAGITAVSRIPSSMEMWWIEQDGSIQDAHWYDTTPFPSSQTWGPIQITFADGTALGGYCTVAANNNGDWTFSGHLHDSGWDPYDFSIVAVILTPSGIGYTFKLNGHTDGTGSTFPFPPNRDFDWTNSGNNPSIRNEWAQVAQAICKVTVVAQDVTAQTISDLLQQAIKDLAARGIEIGIAAIISLL